LYPFGAEQKKIVALGWDLLVGQLQTRELSATAVLRAYIAKARTSFFLIPYTPF